MRFSDCLLKFIADEVLNDRKEKTTSTVTKSKSIHVHVLILHSTNTHLSEYTCSTCICETF